MSEHGDTKRNPVREVRQALGLSQEHMAVKLGCTQGAVQVWEEKCTLPRKPAYLAQLLFLAARAGMEIEL
jgi:DNA-binding transcriptional regulator YiaG